ITVGQISGQVARLGLDWLLTFVAFFSINLAILNLLPIPILDGGQLMFLIAEALRGRPLSRELRTRLSNVGFFLLVVLMILALTHDALRILPPSCRAGELRGSPPQRGAARYRRVRATRTAEARREPAAPAAPGASRVSHLVSWLRSRFRGSASA